MEQTEDPKLSLGGHLEELRSRVLWVVGSMAVGTVIGLVFSKQIYQILAAPMRPVLGDHAFFIATNPLEAFITFMRTGFVAGLFLAVPMIFYQIWQFVAPGLYDGEKKGSLLFVSMTSFFFIGGSLFGYFIVFPTSFQFFAALLTGTDIQLLPKMNEYFSFAVRLLLAFGIVFELPVLMLLLARFGVVTPKALRKARPYTMVGIFVVSGLMTGPDVASQFLMAIPLLVLYELGVLLATFFGGKKCVEN